MRKSAVGKRESIGDSEYITLRKTEQRLFRLPELIQRIEFMEDDLRRLRGDGSDKLRELMQSLPPRIRKRRIQRLLAALTADRLEVITLNRALQCVRSHPYYLTIEYKFFRGLPDSDAAERLGCALTSVRRNRANLIRRIATVLYGTKG